MKAVLPARIENAGMTQMAAALFEQAADGKAGEVDGRMVAGASEERCRR